MRTTEPSRRWRWLLAVGLAGPTIARAGSAPAAGDRLVLRDDLRESLLAAATPANRAGLARKLDLLPDAIRIVDGKSPARRSRPEQAISCSTPCLDRILEVGHPFYDVMLNCTDGGFAARTGAAHPVTVAAGAKQDVIFAGVAGFPFYSDVAFYLHDTRELFLAPLSGQACAFDPMDTAAEPASIGIEQEWLRDPLPGLRLTLREEIVAFGTDADDSGIRLTLAVTNHAASTLPATLGVRWLVDFASGGDDGPLLAAVSCEPLATGPELSTEHLLAAGELRDWLRLRNNTGTPVVSNFLAAVPLLGFADTGAPDRLVFGTWGNLELSPWTYGIGEGMPGPDADSAVHFYYGYQVGNGLTVAPGETFRRSIVMFNRADLVTCPLATCADGGNPAMSAGTDVDGCTGQPITLDASASTHPACPSPLEYRWNSGGGPITAWTTSPTVSVAVAGLATYRVEGRCPSASNCVAADTVVVAEIPPPVAGFTNSPSVCLGCAAVAFTDLSSGQIATWVWDFGDGDSSTERNPSHFYRSPGTYVVTLVVTDSCGRSSTDVGGIAVTGIPTAALAVASPCAGAPVGFDNRSSSDATDFIWDFGDSTAGSTLFEPSHTYALPGVYLVTLRARNGCGEGGPAVVAVTVVDTPVARFTTDAPRCVGPIQFTDTSTGNPTAWAWDFGDGTPLASTANPVHAYAVPGSYDVRLTVTSGCGVSAPVQKAVTVAPDLGAGFKRWLECGILPRTVSAPDPYSPEDTTTSTTQSNSWEFDDGAYCPASPCTFAMYAVADCGTAMTIPLYDNETGTIRIWDLLREQYVVFDTRGGNPTPGCGWSQLGVTEASWRDCSGTRCEWNNVTTTLSFGGSPAVCGVYRLEFFDWGGNWWDLFANCDGSPMPGFTIYDNICEAIAAYRPVPELSVQSLTVSGVCPRYTIEAEVANTGCVAVDVPVRVSSTQGGTVDLVLAGVEPGATRAAAVDLVVGSCVAGTISVAIDTLDTVAECHELTGSSVSCDPDPGAGHFATWDVPDPCVDGPDFCGAVGAEDLSPCVKTGVRIFWPEVIEPGSGFAVTYEVYRDGGLLVAGLTTTEWVDTTGVNGQIYRYRVRAVNGCGIGDPSLVEIDAADAVSPTVVVSGAVVGSVPADCELRVDWAPATGPASITYDVYRSLYCPATSADQRVATALTSPGYTDLAVRFGDGFCYLVTASGPCGDPVAYPPSARVMVSDLTPPTTEPTATATVVSACDVRLDWSGEDACSGLAFDVHRSLTSPWSPDPWTRLATVTSLPYLDTLPIDRTYGYILVARNGAGATVTTSELVVDVVGCATACAASTLTPRQALLGVRDSTGAASFRWSVDPAATAYHLNAVTDKRDLDPILALRPPVGIGQGRCDALTPACTDTVASTPDLVFFQAVSVCGADEGPVF